MSHTCPLETELRAWLNESLEPTAAIALEDHVESCLACQEVVERVLGETPDVRCIPTEATVVENSTSDLSNPAHQVEAPLFHLDEELTAEFLPPLTIPGYRLLDLLGKGGMGIVYKARHVRLNRLVAVKILYDYGRDAHEERLRFLSEAKAIAALDHPHIVRLYEIGRHGDIPYFTLEYCAGGSLAKAISAKEPSPSEAAALLEPVARAVAYAHSKNIIHRDLTPSNVLLTADGTPKVADFGLAKRSNTATALTPTSAVFGTPSYMSPEQASGDGRQTGPATDVYGLGAILYRLLTGRPPFTANTPIAIIQRVINEDPENPRSLRPGIPPDLEIICLKCLQKKPGHRYESAEAVADDLSRFLVGLPIRARRVSMADRAWRWCSRNRPLVGVAAMTAAASVTIAVLTAHLQREQQQSQEAQEQAIQLSAHLEVVKYTEQGHTNGKRGRWKEAADDFAQALALQPRSLSLWLEKADCDARAGQWKQSAEDFDHILDLHPNDHWLWFRSAALRLYLGDRQAYQHHCAHLLGRWGSTEDPIIAERIAKLCFLVPDAVADRAQPLKLAERAVTGTERHEFRDWLLLTRGIAAYRAGQTDEALRWIHKSLSDNARKVSIFRAQAQLFLALAEHQSGHSEEARRLFRDAERILNNQRQKWSQGNIDGDWHDWLLCLSILPEVESRLR